MGGSINTYYDGKLLKRLTAVATLEYPNDDEHAVKKVIVEAVEGYVTGLENKHHINPDGAASNRKTKKKETKKRE